MVIIGRKVGLDYNSWYTCLPLIRHAGQSSGPKLQTLIAGRKSREREKETARCLHTNLLFWVGFLEDRNTMFGSVNQSCYNCFRILSYQGLRLSNRKVDTTNPSMVKMLLPMRIPNPNLSCASAFVRQSRTFHSINALRTFYHMHTFFKLPEYHSGLIWIQTVFANVERETERETGAGTSK